jgi:hypothetical protein
VNSGDGVHPKTKAVKSLHMGMQVVTLLTLQTNILKVQAKNILSTGSEELEDNMNGEV